MIRARVRDNKVLLQRDDEDRKRFIHALNRIEGQVRGVRQMIQDDSYCGDELQQIKATFAGLRRVARLLAEEHVEAAGRAIAEGAPADVIACDIATVLKRVL